MKVLLCFLLIIQLLHASKFPRFVIRGTLKCRGEPVKGNIIMYDDNSFLDHHLLSERAVDEDGEFRLAGEPTDDCLDVKLVIQHKCHSMRIGRRDGRLEGYSKFTIPIEDLIKGDYDLAMNIELSGNKVWLSSPFVPAWRTYIYGKRMFSDLFDRVKNLDLWKMF